MKKAVRRRLSQLVGLPNVFRRLDLIDGRLDQLDALSQVQAQLVSDLRAEAVAQGDFAVERAGEVTQRIVDEVQAQLVSEHVADLASVRRQIRGLETRELAVSESGSPSLKRSKTGRPKVVPRPTTISDALYAGLEDVFRGSESSITSRTAEYLPLLDDIDPQAPVLDLGCGRGEWMSLVNSTGRPSVGVDHNALFVDQCVSDGLDVVQADLIDTLKRQNGASLGAVTLFQVLEHLQFEEVVEIMELAVGALVPGGVLIAEVPNAKNLQVASGTFWIDPTHNRPWYPELLEFLARYAGFSSVTGRYLNPFGEMPTLEGVDPNIAQPLTSLLEGVFGPADYALIATR